MEDNNLDDYNAEDEEDDVEYNNLLTKTFEIHSNDFTIVDEMKIKDNVLYPSNIEIDLERKTITIE